MEGRERVGQLGSLASRRLNSAGTPHTIVASNPVLHVHMQCEIF